MASFVRLLALASSAAAYEVVVTSYEAVDPARSGHKVTATLYLAKDYAEPAPVVAFAHGFGLSADAYPLAQQLVQQRGLVVLLPHNFGVLPSTRNLALDQVFLLAHAVNESSNPASPLYKRVSIHTVLAGHSLGGGSTVLAADEHLSSAYPTPSAMFTVSLGTYTIPNALKSAPHVPASMPALLLTATEDCVDPPAKNSLPVFQAMRSGCAFVSSVVGGSHCQYAASNLGCSTTEYLCGARPNITRETQIEKTLSIVLPFLDAVFSGKPEAWTSFNSVLENAVKANTVQLLAHRSDSCTRLAAPEVGNKATAGTLDADFAGVCQRRVAHSFSGHLSVTVLQADEGRFLITKPSAQVDKTRTQINVTMLMHEEKTTSFSHSIALKMKSGEYLTPSAGADDVTCASLHKASLEIALLALNATERDGYSKLAKRLSFGEDEIWHSGLYVALAKVKVSEDTDTLTLVAPRFITSPSLPGQWGGVFYCRLVPPAAMRDWIRRQLLGNSSRPNVIGIVV